MNRSRDSRRTSADPDQGRQAEHQDGKSGSAEQDSLETRAAHDEGFDDLGDLFSDADPLSSPNRVERSAPLEPERLQALIAQALEELGLDAKSASAPALKPLAGLHDRRVLLVDDAPEVFAAFVPGLLAATNGAALFLMRTQQKAPMLVTQILKLKPDLVLLDGELGLGLRGWDVSAQLFSRQPKLPVIGFSSDGNYEKHFLSHSALGFVTKRREDVPHTLREVDSQARLVLDHDIGI